MHLASITMAALLWAGPALADEPCAPVKPCEIPDAGPPGEREAPADFASQARQLFDLLSCEGNIPQGLAPEPVKAYCARQARLAAKREETRAALQALLRPLRPARLPSAVVYPLSGSDLASALAAYPDARNVTLTSSRAAGDPRVLARLHDPAALAVFLNEVAEEGERLVRGEGGERDLGRPGSRPALPILLWALAAEGDEPVALRYLNVEPAGTLRYLGAAEIASRVRDGTGPDPFASCELSFVRRGEPPGTLPRFARNLRVDLSDAGIAADPGPLAHLASKGSFAAVLDAATKLSGEGYARLRELLLGRSAFVVTDGTGPTPDQLRQAGLLEESHPRPGGSGRVVLIRRP